ncbi:uncharacterized protein PHALS_02566 [Plasmopara halstedii]|uniref:Uncharacterized protein n=1 Tax=Plasmopara halstedii TaxID=4781 RepID=A0A0P1AXA3_PLAHL|nr:uncharacterized protein PHALS_02566 [Plasmopara halstedii]CEG46146.1 hypothetical protein PHALS_02566 [Plasmopara halstedii]|eukprot:XP_024582515.1 hypothetical protein PHALS_02566 [Plasmopara halstedii]
MRYLQQRWSPLARCGVRSRLFPTKTRMRFRMKVTVSLEFTRQPIEYSTWKWDTPRSPSSADEIGPLLIIVFSVAACRLQDFQLT